MTSSQDVGNQAIPQAGNRVLEEELALLEPPQLQLVLGGAVREPRDDVVEVVVLDLERQDARLDLDPFLVGQRLGAQGFLLLTKFGDLAVLA